jgi:hypothetical protein
MTFPTSAARACGFSITRAILEVSSAIVERRA